jgi:hypothetical protein
MTEIEEEAGLLFMTQSDFERMSQELYDGLLPSEYGISLETIRGLCEFHLIEGGVHIVPDEELEDLLQMTSEMDACREQVNQAIKKIFH